MTNEEIEALSEESIELFSRKAKDYEESKKNLARVKEIHDIIHQESMRRLAESYRADGIDPHAPCPTCGHIPISKKP
jgi:DNA repair exonuclease SbcCD ATPase subunit